MENQLNYFKISRQEWYSLDRHKALNIKLSSKKLNHILSLNDRISQADVQEVYLPLVRLLEGILQNQQEKQKLQANFLGIQQKHTPFIIGIAGSVAVGKSTTARLLQNILQEVYPNKMIRLITTDGFLYPNAELKRRQLMEKKGFPESYDMDRLLRFVDDVRNGLPAKAPVYSHNTYDIVAGEYEVINQVDILIIEGINTLQLPSNQQLYVSDYFDFSIYVDAKEELIKKWYLERFNMLLDIAQNNPNDYYYSYAIGSREVAMKMARNVWQKVNHPNLLEYILPTRNRADLIMSKGENHLVNELFLRKY